MDTGPKGHLLAGPRRGAEAPLLHGTAIRPNKHCCRPERRRSSGEAGRSSQSRNLGLASVRLDGPSGTVDCLTCANRFTIAHPHRKLRWVGQPQPEAAAYVSPGRKPWDTSQEEEPVPEGRQKDLLRAFSFAPSGLGDNYPPATHGLRRGLHSVAAPRLGRSLRDRGLSHLREPIHNCPDRKPRRVGRPAMSGQSSR